VEAQSYVPPEQIETPRPAQATPCDLSIPLQISLTLLNEPGVGSTARFAASIESGIDPDLVKQMWVEYEVPERMRQSREYLENREIPRMARTSRQELAVVVPDKGRYQIRARLMVELVNGKTISKTATQWINLGNSPPEGLVGRIVDPDGTGIRVYQGVTVRN
jgi:hypothetical protein